MKTIPICAPAQGEPKPYSDPAEAVAELKRLYEEATLFLRERFAEVLRGGPPECRYRAYYPEIRLTTAS